MLTLLPSWIIHVGLSVREIRRVFRIIETTRHPQRNRLEFVVSIGAGLKIGEISALTSTTLRA